MCSFGYDEKDFNDEGKPKRGAKRQCFESECQPYKARVVGVTYRLTGTYVPASPGWYGYEEYEYEPAYLTNQTSHLCILTREHIRSSEVMSLANQIEKL